MNKNLLILDTNSKRVLNNIKIKFKSYFYFNKNKELISSLFPYNDFKIIKNYNNFFKKADFFNNYLNFLSLEEIDFENLDKIKIFPYEIYVFDKNLKEKIENSFGINSFLISKYELEDMINNNQINKDMIFVGDEYINLELNYLSYKEFSIFFNGYFIFSNRKKLLKILKIIISIFDKIDKEKLIKFKEIFNLYKEVFKFDFSFEFDQNSYRNLYDFLNESFEEKVRNLYDFLDSLNEKIEKFNLSLEEEIQNQKLELSGDKLLNLIKSGDLDSLKKELENNSKEKIDNFEYDIINYFKKENINIEYIFEEKLYPLSLSEEMYNYILNLIKDFEESYKEKYFMRLGSLINFKNVDNLINFLFFIDFVKGISEIRKKFNLNDNFEFSSKLELVFFNSENIFIENPIPITYAVGFEGYLNEVKLNGEKISLLTGANSGGKTTLLELILQNVFLGGIGIGVNSSKLIFSSFEKIIYLKKFTGVLGSGAFEQTIRKLINILDDSDSKKLVLIDEFESITEPGAAANILIQFLKELNNSNSLCVVVSHLGKEIKEHLVEHNINYIRIDGISAEGLDSKGNLITNHQPKFYELGKSTPELILQKILIDEKYWKNKKPKTKEIFSNILKKRTEPGI